MLVGPTMAGKTSAYRSLGRAMTALNAAGDRMFEKVNSVQQTTPCLTDTAPYCPIPLIFVHTANWSNLWQPFQASPLSRSGHALTLTPNPAMRQDKGLLQGTAVKALTQTTFRGANPSPSPNGNLRTALEC